MRLDTGDRVGGTTSVNPVAGALRGDAVGEGLMGLETEVGLAVSGFTGGQGKTAVFQLVRCILERVLDGSDASVVVSGVTGGQGKTVVFQLVRCILERYLDVSVDYVATALCNSAARAVDGDMLHTSFSPRELLDGKQKMDLGRQGNGFTDAVVETRCVVFDETSMVSSRFFRLVGGDDVPVGG